MPTHFDLFHVTSSKGRIFMDITGVNHMPALVNACANLLYLSQIMMNNIIITTLQQYNVSFRVDYFTG